MNSISENEIEVPKGENESKPELRDIKRIRSTGDIPLKKNKNDKDREDDNKSNT